MILQRNTLLWAKLNGLLRYVLMHTASRALPLYIVNEYPKSGGSWVGEMLAEALGVPFPRNRLPLFGSCILHGHVMHSWNMHNVLLVWRDGRDVLISQYFHCLFENDRGNARLVKMCRADLAFADYSDVRANLTPFMEYVYERNRHPAFSWAEFAMRWATREDCVHVRYEDMRSNPIEELLRITRELGGGEMGRERAESIVASHSFEKMSGRNVGDEKPTSFMRKGVVGDWRNYFDFEARQRFAAYAGDALVRLGYESDESWISG